MCDGFTRMIILGQSRCDCVGRVCLLASAELAEVEWRRYELAPLANLRKLLQSTELLFSQGEQPPPGLA